MSKSKPNRGPVHDLYVAATAIANGTRKVMREHGQQADALHIPILIAGTDMRIVIECGPAVAASNAIQKAQIKADNAPGLGLSDAQRRAADLLRFKAQQSETNEALRDECLRVAQVLMPVAGGVKP
jgi:hypothetical protein